MIVGFDRYPLKMYRYKHQRAAQHNQAFAYNNTSGTVQGGGSAAAYIDDKKFIFVVNYTQNGS